MYQDEVLCKACEEDNDPQKLRAEIDRLSAALKKANEQAEHFEREWYLRGDAIERATEVARNACEGWNDALMHEGARMAADAVAALLTPNIPINRQAALGKPNGEEKP